MKVNYRFSYFTLAHLSKIKYIVFYFGEQNGYKGF
ncbi:hypothetical protein Spica_2699 [Gracilinema caldarium DSM 7334]|uniref:Uncharacterized protein n=1 Tax=Gracilinema caldarium (strain ATCC 51460 / DSM 7334 / H1) TaxID=744872 RepID=F8F106_GRAC1|nr:hypothetical protein Spica_2699 [Gracilinema caldarium DSM 7334]